VHDRPPGTVLARVAVATLGVAGLFAPASAFGHASSEVPHARIAADGATVEVTWQAAADDAADVGVAVGRLPPEAVEAYLGGPIDDLPSDDAIAELSSSPELRDYLLEHIAVSQAGRPCPGVARPAPDFLADGATVSFTCPAEVEVVDLRITMLHDRDPAYRTFGVDGGLQTTAHTVRSPEHPWDVTRSPSASGPGADVAWLAGGVVLALVAGVALLVRRPGRDRSEAAA
jgi:hypothetical protein